MTKTLIVTDSTSDIPQEVLDQYGIVAVPLQVMFGEETYADGVDITAGQFYEKLVKSKELPTTSQPSPASFMAAYQDLLDRHPDADIVSIHLSSGLSGTYQSALLAQSMLDQPERVTVLDSKSASYGYGLLVVHAAELARQGARADSIARAVEELHQHRKLYFLVDNLEYLQKGGRIGKASAMLGTLLNIKPILSIDEEGIIYAVEKVRGHKKAMARIVEMFEQDFKGRPVHVALGHTADPSSVEPLRELLDQHFDVADVVYTNVGAVIGTHVGPGVIAVFVWPV
ncbi:DegV family protein [Paenibacillus sp. JX-17]|uniref:DegV family protein n=1 Tax=Paenibacillus lacisoli TaxID=3064525 RepID=A0ABT9C7J6_9BACL|nr:DegV family protein [Paenibacillus sp. JX-17]MDO7905237.1 DegV family protein [Paenibacillus sp. JX-17]